RCQSVVGALVRIEALAPVPAVQPARRRWFAWLIPLAAATAAIALWVVVPRGPGAAPPPVAQEQNQPAQTQQSEHAAPAPPPSPSSSPKVEQQATAKSDQP